MPRPKIPGTETIQTFNCSYILKMGLMRATEITRKSNPSSLIRAELEEVCRRILGDQAWSELKQTGEAPDRMHLFNDHLVDWNTRRLRDVLSDRKTDGELTPAETAGLLAGMESYWRDLVRDRDREHLSLPLRATLMEAADIVYKVMRPFQSKPTPKVIAATLVSIRNLPGSLRDDFEAAAMHLAGK